MMLAELHSDEIKPGAFGTASVAMQQPSGTCVFSGYPG